MPNEFRAIQVTKTQDRTFPRAIITRSTDDLPAGDLLIQVLYSSLNYKDALSATGHPGVTQNFPHTPGIDAVGIVEQSDSERFDVGDQVIVTGFDFGMNTAGGYGQYIRVPSGWAVRLPEGLSPFESMVFGTAGFTAGLCVQELKAGGVDTGEILVTGATGGVGSLAVGILSQLGYTVVAATGKTEERPFLENLGASEVIDRKAADDDSGKPLLSGRWAGVVDSVGGSMLATAIKSATNNAVITCCGLVASAELSTTVYPFILRGTRLVGINSVDVPIRARQGIWQQLAGEWKFSQLERLSTTVTLDNLDGEIDKILEGRQRGRVVVDTQRGA
jgi:acrylyl-CoA reductase (NADPH)